MVIGVVDHTLGVSWNNTAYIIVQWEECSPHRQPTLTLVPVVIYLRNQRRTSTWSNATGPVDWN